MIVFQVLLSNLLTVETKKVAQRILRRFGLPPLLSTFTNVSP